ncbi:MAG: hypothetical protein P8M18_07605 [Woeseiaceae bacterium]|nr:hypothetical protein [Woeseiaceae bacterium]
MTEPHDIAAVFFDMDGTLIDSELNTEPAITSVCCELGLPDPAQNCTAFGSRRIGPNLERSFSRR